MRPSWVQLWRLQCQLLVAFGKVEQGLQQMRVGQGDLSGDSGDESVDSDSEVTRRRRANVIRHATATSLEVKMFRALINVYGVGFQPAELTQLEGPLVIREEAARRLDNALQGYEQCLVARDDWYTAFQAESSTGTTAAYADQAPRNANPEVAEACQQELSADLMPAQLQAMVSEQLVRLERDGRSRRTRRRGLPESVAAALRQLSNPQAR